MKKRLKIVFFILVVIIIIASIEVIIIVKNNFGINFNKEQKWNNEFSNTDKNEVNYNENVTVNDLKEEMELVADSNLYEVTKEYDGRKILNIKADILYKVAFAGIIKQSKPNFEEVDKIFNENYPSKKGIWISGESRKKFLELIKGETASEYEIDKEGYLKIKNSKNQNENDKKLESIMNSDIRLIIDINSIDYEVDIVTGEIVEYPFEQLGDIIDIISNDNEKIIAISKNKNKIFSDKEILENLLSNI